jgi:hypothetical protein
MPPRLPDHVMPQMSRNDVLAQPEQANERCRSGSAEGDFEFVSFLFFFQFNLIRFYSIRFDLALYP